MKKILSALLASVLALTVLVSCKDKAEKNTGAESLSVSEETEKENYSEIETYVSSLAEGKDYSSRTFKIIGKDSENFPVSEEITGNLSSDSVYERQRALEEKFGIEVSNIIVDNGDTTKDMVIQEVFAGGNSYDLVIGAGSTVGQYLYQSGVLYSTDDLEVIDISREWWSRNLSSDLSIKGKLYFLTGPAVTEFYSEAAAVLFNKKLASDFSVPDMYGAVKDGSWTLDRFTEIASAVPENDTGSGKYRFVTRSGDGLRFLAGAGLSFTSYDEDQIPTIPDSLPMEMSDLCDRLGTFLSDHSQTAYVKFGNESFEDAFGSKDWVDFFKEDNSLFYLYKMSEVYKLRESDVEFGILPYPKKDSSQKEYVTLCEGEGMLFIPMSSEDLEFTGTITEAAAALSEEYVRPAFYEKILKGRSVYDYESRDMIDLIFKNAKYDLIFFFGGGDRNTMGEFLEEIDCACTGFKDTSLASNYAILAKVTNRNIQRTVK